jgi:hypothetical protein
MERDLYLRCLLAACGDRSKVAAVLGVTTATVYTKIRIYGLQVPSSLRRRRREMGDLAAVFDEEFQTDQFFEVAVWLPEFKHYALPYITVSLKKAEAKVKQLIAEGENPQHVHMRVSRRIRLR